MKTSILLIFLIAFGVCSTINARELEISANIIQISDQNFNVEVTIADVVIECKVELYEFNAPQWLGGKPIIEMTSKAFCLFENISAGKYYIVVYDTENNAGIKLIELPQQAKN